MAHVDDAVAGVGSHFAVVDFPMAGVRLFWMEPAGESTLSEFVVTGRCAVGYSVGFGVRCLACNVLLLLPLLWWHSLILISFILYLSSFHFFLSYLFIVHFFLKHWSEVACDNKLFLFYAFGIKFFLLCSQRSYIVTIFVREIMFPLSEFPMPNNFLTCCFWII